MTLRTRFGALIAGLLAACLLAAGVALYWSERSLLRDDRAAAREAAMAQFAQTCRDALVLGDELGALNAASRLAASPSVRSAYCLDGGGAAVAHSDVRRVGAPPAAPGAGDGVLDREVPVGAGPPGRAVIVFDRDALDADLRRALGRAARRIAGLLAGVLFLGLAGAALLARGIVRPIHAIADGTRALAEGKWDHRLDFRRDDELGRLARDFDRMSEKLGVLDRMKNDFVANVTHELRSPLAAIESYSNLIADELREGRTAEAVDYLAVVRNNTTRLGRFVDDVLVLSKIQAKAAVLRARRTEVKTLVDDAVSLFRPKAAEGGVTLSGAVEPPGLVAEIDPDKIQQILTNLVSNALKFTPSGGRVTVAASSAEGRLTIAVQDTGPGVPSGERDRIFGRFEQGRPAPGAGAKGTGLGLAISRGLAEAHGGTIRLESPPEGGSRFVVELPLERGRAS
jgi:signal transduction histidine kinase